ncbi:hypothetical protein ENUP19_0340G0011 [Entamoeba nuttalli]|uniref:RNA recognition motif domain containing protein n=2 Tax=Entamoeba nuttalli TaxID=412467 RepID=K2GG74_ENTNP|nr:RNA recognition motif domain containing protein [Entamoeba nuttalli P19]EKE41706.1 RNA recognition motif domain containing protein [Entamoeba nuttalli P19]|eukprot:XP_008855974.1 RNA recognition motif domain containing protein [Entamoeba nuttalli P19]
MSGVLNRYGKRENSAPMATLFFARLGPMMKEEILKKVCNQYGEVEEVTMVCDRETKKSKGCAFVSFKTPLEAQKCFSNVPEIINEHHWIIEWAKSTQIRDSDLDKKTLYITGLQNCNANDTSVYDHFSVYGLVEKVTVVGKGADFPPYAFVKFTDEKSAGLALKNENGKFWDGGQLIIQYSETLESKKSRRLHRVKQTNKYMEIKKEPSTRRSFKEIFVDDSTGSLIQSLLMAFGSFTSSEYLTEGYDEEGYDEVLVRPNIKDIRKVDSPLLKNYEKLIHQLDDDDNSSLTDVTEDDILNKHTFSFLDDEVWGPYQ